MQIKSQKNYKIDFSGHRILSLGEADPVLSSIQPNSDSTL